MYRVLLKVLARKGKKSDITYRRGKETGPGARDMGKYKGI